MAESKRYEGNFLEKLANDEKYLTMRREKNAEHEAAVAKNRVEQASLVEELRNANFSIVINNIPGQEYEGPPRSIGDLINTGSPYPEAIPILVQHLPMNYGKDIKEGIIRALATPEARGIATDKLVIEFLKIKDPNSSLKWVIGLSLSETTTLETAERIANLALDKSHGYARNQLPLGLINIDPKMSLPYLEEMLNDPDTKESAEIAIKQLQK